MLRFKKYFVLSLLVPLTTQASFIESTMGTAVVNDATATYYNPAALTLVKNRQIIGLGSVAYFHTNFNGQSTQTGTGFTQSGSSSSNTQYYLPSAYFGIPASDRVTAGLAIISDHFTKDIGENSILRYEQANGRTDNIDFAPGVGIKLNEFVSVGAGLTFSFAKFLTQPTLGFPSLNIPDTESRNQSGGSALAGDMGFLFKPNTKTLVGFNYRSSSTYNLSGQSTFESTPQVISNNYKFKFWTPARYVLSANHFLTKTLGLIATVQFIQWNIFQTMNIHGIATQINSQPVFVDANVPFHLHNSWVLTVGGISQLTPKWIVRFASSYYQSPANSNYQLGNGDSIIVGGSVGYALNKNFIIDGSYAHAFIKNENINITTSRNTVTGVNKGYRDSVSLKLTVNV